MARVPSNRVYRSKFQPPKGLEGKDLGKWMQEELRQVTRSIEGISEAASTGYLPVLRPEDFGVTGEEESANADAVSAAFDAMIEETGTRGGAIWYCAGHYPISRPIYVPSSTFILGTMRSDKPNLGSSIHSVTGDFDILKLAQDVENFMLMNMCIGHLQDVTPTDGCAIDMRWLKNGYLFHNNLYNVWNGIDGGVCRSTNIEYLRIVGCSATGSGMGPDAPDPNSGFGLLFRSTQTLLDGNVGRETDFWDRDGSGVTVEPNSKGTSVSVKNVYVNPSTVTGDEDTEPVYSNYQESFTGLWLIGVSTIRFDRFQARHCEWGVRAEYAPNREGVDRDGDDTGLQLCADVIIQNGSGEGNITGYKIGGYEKFQLINCQANSSAGVCFDIGDVTGDTYPGFPVGTTPVEHKGGFFTGVNCLALTTREEGFLLRSGIIRLLVPSCAGYGKNEPGDIAPKRAVEFNVTSSSVAYAFDSSQSGTYSVKNTGSTTFKFTVGNSGVTEDNGAPSGDKNSISVTAGSYVLFDRNDPANQTHIAVRTSSGTSTGAAGPEAALDASGITIKAGCDQGVTIIGGTISKDNSMQPVGSPGTQPAIKIQDNVDKVWITGVDVAEGGFFGNDSEDTAEEMQIRDLVRSNYRFSTYPEVYISGTKTGAYTARMLDNGNVVDFNSAGAANFTIPPNASVPFPIGAQLNVVNRGAGAITVAEGAGVTVEAANAILNLGQGGKATQVAVNVWVFER